MADFGDFLTKKVANVKVAYWLIPIALGLAIWAVIVWRQSKLDNVATGDVISDVTGSDGSVPAAYPGTVYAVSDSTDNAEEVSYDNSNWIKDGIQYLTGSNKATSLEAQSVLQKYINGENLTWAESQLINPVIDSVGAPPILGEVGDVEPEPAPASTGTGTSTSTSTSTGTSTGTSTSTGTGTSTSTSTSKPASTSTSGMLNGNPTPGKPKVHKIVGKDIYVSLLGLPSGVTKVQFRYSADANFTSADKIVQVSSGVAKIHTGYHKKKYGIRARYYTKRGRSAWGPAIWVTTK